jgi:predicted DsbA family dithiol-disulfide isomerase
MNRVINMWSDIICPFCYLDSVWAEEAARELQATLRVLPFELHPETPPGGAPKPFSPEAWPQIRARLREMALEVGLPIDPPERNVNSRFALETAELVRVKRGDDTAGAFHHDLSRAFFTQRADISKPDVVIPVAEGHGVSASDVEAAWQERRFLRAVDAFIDQARKAGVTGVPAIAWPNQRAIVGMMRPEDVVVRLSNQAH